MTLPYKTFGFSLAGLGPSVMVDLRAYGYEPGAALLSIGAVAFDPEIGLGERFQIAIDPESSERAGMTIEPYLRDFWGRSGRAYPICCPWPTNSMTDALNAFTDYIKTVSAGRDVHVWQAPGPFKLSLLRAAYLRAGFGKTPWAPALERDYATLAPLFRGILARCEGTSTVYERNGAITPAMHLCRIADRMAEIDAQGQEMPCFAEADDGTQTIVRRVDPEDWKGLLK